MKRNYFWAKLDQSPFTVVVALADHLMSQIQVPNSQPGKIFSKESNLKRYFSNSYRIHQDWIYCRSIAKNFREIKLGEIDVDNCEMTPEEELVGYLSIFNEIGWVLEPQKDQCNEKLMKGLIFDAEATEHFSVDTSKKSKIDSLIEKFGLNVAFVATSSGLLRYKTFDKSFDG